MWLLWDAVSDSTQGFPRGAERWQSLWLAHHTDLLCPDLRSVGLPASDLALERRAILLGFGPCLSPVVHNFFTTRKCQGWSFLFHPKKCSCLITRLSSWPRRLGNSAPGRVQKHVCAISHSIKIYLPSKHSDKLIQSWDTDLNSHLARTFSNTWPDMWYRVDLHKCFVGLVGRNIWPIKAAETSYHPCSSISHVFLPHWNSLDFFPNFHKHNASWTFRAERTKQGKRI